MILSFIFIFDLQFRSAHDGAAILNLPQILLHWKLLRLLLVLSAFPASRAERWQSHCKVDKATFVQGQGSEQEVNQMIPHSPS